MADIDQTLQADIDAIADIAAVPTILKILSKTTGLRFSAVARVTEARWIVCSALDNVPYGMGPGSELPIETTFCDSIRAGGPPVLFDQASTHPVYSQHPSPKMYGLESYASFPIRLPDGSFFGTLCALDPEPIEVDTPDNREMFELFANVIGHHLSTRNRMNVALSSLHEERATSGLREQFIAVLGHDLRTPLGAIRNGAQVLARSAVDARSTKIAKLIDGSATRMSGLIDDVLDFTRGRLGGGMALEIGDGARLEPALRQVIAELQASATGHLIEARIDLPSGGVRCDLNRVSQLASNLLGNALTYGDPAAPVNFTAEVTDDEFVLTVANTGEPISAETRSRIFEPFERSAESHNKEGLGLGLFIAHSIASAHRGTLGVTSDTEQTKFTFRMPTQHGTNQ